MVRRLLPLVLLAPLAVAACSSGESAQTTGTMTASNVDPQAREAAQQALTTAQQAQATANDAKAEADRMNQNSLKK